jgi:hypothetical protein
MKTSKVENKKSRNWSAIIIYTFVSLIFAYVVVDFVVIRNKIEDKIDVLNIKFDSLEVVMDVKLPAIDKAIRTQAEQVKELQEISKQIPQK